MSSGYKDDMEIILNKKESKRIIRLLHYLSVTGQLGLKSDTSFFENMKEHYEACNNQMENKET
jgi:hypothetical protein